VSCEGSVNICSYFLTKKALLRQGFWVKQKGLWLDRDRGEFGGIYVDEAAMLAFVLEADDAIDLGEEGIVFAATDVGTWLERGAALTDDDASTEDRLPTEYFDSEPLGV